MSRRDLDEADRQRIAVAAAKVLKTLGGKKADPRYDQIIKAYSKDSGEPRAS